MNAITPTGDTPVLADYDKILVAFSGGKDSMACVLLLLDLGVPPEKIELHHHDVDGAGSFADWPVTESYCRAAARHFGMEIVFSAREGGFLREMERDETATAPVIFWSEGRKFTVGGRGRPGTRRQFPQVSGDLRVRWCSPYLKIDVMDAVIRHDPRLAGLKLLVVTGERAEESSSRARYARFERHRTDRRDSRAGGRFVDHWRPVHHLDRAAVWDLMRKHGVVPHPAYYLGWGRLSCMKCIFGSADQWATIRAIDPRGFERYARKEREYGKTIHRTRSVTEQADRGTPYEATKNRDLVELALGFHFGAAIRVDPADWRAPAGTTGEDTGPT